MAAGERRRRPGKLEKRRCPAAKNGRRRRQITVGQLRDASELHRMHRTEIVGFSRRFNVQGCSNLQQKLVEILHIIDHFCYLDNQGILQDIFAHRVVVLVAVSLPSPQSSPTNHTQRRRVVFLKGHLGKDQQRNIC